MIRRHPPLLLAVRQPSRLQQHQLVIAQHWPPSMRELNFPRVPIRGVPIQGVREAYGAAAASPSPYCEDPNAEARTECAI
ncbi:hypothetical protein PAL_GLEAN10024584 [Pteropus alecto]|uniref:Uncharacterized protein n=1 Tax=Pteropus alecto TaxID=9402 RepID=L5JYE0_PTEAL|nr:hypothetical protein PAL_GLEAN10024584 [Pteropus alecto]